MVNLEQEIYNKVGKSGSVIMGDEETIEFSLR